MSYNPNINDPMSAPINDEDRDIAPRCADCEDYLYDGSARAYENLCERCAVKRETCSECGEHSVDTADSMCDTCARAFREFTAREIWEAAKEDGMSARGLAELKATLRKKYDLD